MKKSTKKLLGLGTSLLIGSAGVIAGIGALKLDQSGSSINQNNASRAVQNDGFELTSHDSFIIGKNLNQTEIYNNTPNITKPVPNGYVTVTRDSKLICIDKNDPNKVLWYDNFWSDRNILATEYTPYNDTLVVLYSNGNRTSGSSTQVLLAKYSGISSKKDGGRKTEDSVTTIVSYSYDGNTFREDTWGLSPIYKTSIEDGDNAQVTSYLIFPKVQTNSNGIGSLGDYFWEYSIKDDSVNKYDVSYHHSGYYQMIAGIGSWIFGNKVHVVALMLREIGNSRTIIQPEYFIKGSSNNVYASKGKLDVKDIEGNLIRNSWAVLSEALRSNISGAAFSFNSDTTDMKITFALNVWGGKTSTNNFHLQTQLITTSVWCEGEIFSGTSGPWRNNLWDETWGGYFDNSVIAAKGIKNITASPLLLEGQDQRIADTSKGYDGRFTAVINNPTSWGTDTFNPTKNLNDNRWRIYMQTDDEAVNASNSTYYSNFNTSVDISHGYRLGLYQGAFGIPVLEYHDNNNNDSTIFNLNVMFMKNGSNNGIIINQKDRGSNTQNTATYGYYTHASTTSNAFSGYGNSNYAVNLVDKAYLYDKLKLGGNISYWYSSSFMTNGLKMKNVRDDAKFLIKEDTITHNYNAGSVSFDLYATIVYTSTGQLNHNSVTSMEQNGNWWANHKIGTFTLMGFKPVKVTKIKDFKIDSSLVFVDLVAPNLIPSEVVTNQYNFSNSRAKLLFKNFVWQSICRGDVFTNLVSTPTYNESSWEQDFDTFFPRFDIEKTSGGQFNNAEGSVTLNVKVSKRWAVPAPNSSGDLVSFDNWTISGLRKIGATQFVNNTEATAFINPNWSNKNIPYADDYSIDNEEIQWPNYVAPGVEKITTDEIKEFLFENYIKPAYAAATTGNQYETSTQWVKNVAYKTNYGWQSSGRYRELTKDNIVMTTYRYFPATGKMKLDIRLNVWNKNDQMLHWAQGVEVGGTQQWPEPEINAPFGTWWIGGFRTDNVTTFVDQYRIWELDGIDQIPAGDAYNQQYWTTMHQAIVGQGVQKGYLKFPYWVNIDDFKGPNNDYGGLIKYDLVEVVDAANGIAKIKVTFKNNYWAAQNDGKVAELAADVGEKIITIKGFRLANNKPISIDSSKFFNFSAQLLTSPLYLDPTQRLNEFVRWLNQTEDKILDYIVDQDQAVNQGGAHSKEEWKRRLQFNYSINNTTNEAFTFTSNNAVDAINQELARQTGKLGFMYSDSFTNGLKLWIKITDLEPDSLYALEDHSTDNQKGFELKGLLDTQNVILQLNMNEWIENLKTHRGTVAQGANQQDSTIQSIKPPVLGNSTYGSNMEFSQIETFLKAIGYKFSFSWQNSNGEVQNSDTLPTNFSYNSKNPIINVTISYASEDTVPRIYIFDDSLHSTKSVTTYLSLAVKKTLKINSSFFESMYQYLNIDESNKNITISSTGVGNSSTIDAIKTSWSQFEEQYWELNNNANKDEYKQQLQIVYSVNGSDFTLDLNSMWEKINEGWAEATNNISKIGKLRFYSPIFKYGTKIQAKVVFKDGANLDEYAIEYEGNSQVIVNHKLSTTFDMTKYAEFWSTTKSKANEGSTFDNLRGFTPATFNNVTFDQFVQETEKQLGLLIQYSNDGKNNWVDSRELITSVDQFDPAVYMRFSSKTDDYTDWGNNFEIKNFSTGVTDTTSTNESVKWSSGVKLPLNLPKYLQVEKSWIDEFIAANPLSGNTKYLSINEVPENELIDKIVKANPPLPGTQAPTVWLEYRLGATGTWNKRAAFIEALKSSTKDATTNLIQIKVNVDPIDVNDPVYVVQDTVYDLHEENISDNAVIKIFVNESYETQANNVAIRGTNTQFTYRYGQLPVNENGDWTGANGLMIQWTTDQSATYQDASSDNKWENAQISSIDPVARYLAIRIIAKVGYVYGANYTDNNHNPNPQADIHVVNVDEIRSKIEVDLDTLKALDLSGYVHDLNTQQLITSEQQILNNVQGGNNLAIRYQVVLADGNKLNNDWVDATALKTLLSEYSVNYQNSSQGLIKFKVSGSSIAAASIKATFVSINDQFIPIDKNNADLDQGIETNTDKVKTKVDLSTWYEVLKTKPTLFRDGSTSANIQGITPPGIEGTFGSGFLVGMDYGQITTLLKTIGLEAQFKAPGSSTSDNWVSLDEIHDLNNANELYIRFKVIDEFADSVEVWGDKNSAQDNSQPVEVKLIINLPITLIVSIDELKKLQFVGNTAGLRNFDALKLIEQEIINKIIQDSQTSDTATNDKINAAKLGIKYVLNGKPGEKTWMTLEEVKDYLTTSKANFSSNEVKAKVFILDNPPIDEYGTLQFQLSSYEEVVIQPEQFDDAAQFKVYIHQTDPTNPDWIFANKYLEGSKKQYVIKDLDAWTRDINALKGLELEFNSVSNNGQPADDGWSTQYNANEINKNKDYWVRFKVKPGFVFENALPNNPQYSAPIKLDASRIKVTISLQSNWLEQLVLTGNTKNLNINEDAVIALVNNELPDIQNKEKLIKIQYTIDGQEWLTKDDFINKLNGFDGGLSETKWIILREDIKARFVIDNDINNQFNPPYGLEIDGIIIDNESQSPIIQLIDDTKQLNSTVKGYINANKLTPFIASNFFVTGTNTKTVLRTKEVAKFNTMLDGYKSAQIFDILYTPEANNFIQENKVWDPEGKGIVEELTLKGNFANEYIAINLKASSDKYDVYHNGQIQVDGYIISSPNIKVSLSIEIINPLIGKTVAITYINDQKQVIFYQNDGSFLFNITTDDGRQMNFDDFIAQLPIGNDTEAGQYTQDMKNAMELAYYVSNRPLTNEEYKEITKPSNIQKAPSATEANEKYGVWKSAPTLNESTNLSLAVNDYIIVALRIKPEFLSDPSKDDSGFVLRDDEHTPTQQSRAHGYKVRTSEIQVNWDSMEVKNVGAPVNTDKGLDGFAVLNKLSLIEDAGKNYQGVSLKLNYFNDFYRSASDEILVSNSGDRLVKRETTGIGINKGDKPYYGSDGQPIRDKQGQEVFPYYDFKNRPSHPTKESNSTRSLNLSEKEDNIFSFYNQDGNIEGITDLTAYSLFANQYIQIEFMNKKGLSTEPDVYDYYVDQANVTREYTLPTSLIKFLVSNVNNIRYEFNSPEFKQIIADPNPANVFVNTKDATQLPKNGESRIKDDIMYKVTKTETGQSDVELSTLEQIKQQIESDFSSQVKLQTSIRRKNSNWEKAIDYGRIQEYNNLQNGDFIKVEIVPTNDEFVYAQQPEPLTFQITTLTIENAPTDLFKWLRVEQVGEWDGEGSFRIYVDDPNNPNDDNLTIEDLSNGKYYFEAQVWSVDPSTGEKTIKHKWTRDIDTINDLKNGDKVAWQLRSPEGTVYSAYFNTVADIANHNSSEDKYSFVQINKRGAINITPPVLQPESGPIGPKPADEDAYPETSGFEIANLRIRDQDQEFTSISYDTFASLIKEMNFSYQGVNGNGNMISSKDPRNVTVDIEKPTQLRAKRATTFTLQYLIDQGYLSFAYNTIGLSDFNRFSWNQVKDPSGNYLVAPGLLSNGDKVKAIYKDPTMSTAYGIQLNDVWGLSKKTDSMPMFAWIGIGVASVATLGIFAFIYFFARNRKLKS